MDFASLGLRDTILSAVAAQGYATPTPIQARAIPHILAGEDCLGIAQTGTGKTAAFAIPIIQRLMDAPPVGGNQPKRPRALILSPTRELATQIAQSFRTYGDGSGLTGTTIFGGVGQGGQIKALQRGIDILVATPGRLLDLMGQGYIDLRCIEIFVLDEADRMLDMGFIKPIRQIIAEIPKARQSLLFSATMPGEIQGLADSMLSSPVRVEVAPPRSTASTVTQSLAFVPRALKVGTLINLLGDESLSRVIVFTKTKHGADKVATKLHNAGFDSEAIHGNRNQNQRQRALNAFKSGRVRVLVATDVAARGLDVDDITHVINLDLPMEPEAYVHRIGRTGRAGASGIAISFCDDSERPLLRDIERMLGKKIPLVRLDLDQVESDTAPRPLHTPDPHDPRHVYDRELDDLIAIKPDWNRSAPGTDAPRADHAQPKHPTKPKHASPRPRQDRAHADHAASQQPRHPLSPQHRFTARQDRPTNNSSNTLIRRGNPLDQSNLPQQTDLSDNSNHGQPPRPLRGDRPLSPKPKYSAPRSNTQRSNAPRGESSPHPSRSGSNRSGPNRPPSKKSKGRFGPPRSR
jgi:ATP-dependent RNA helicase RhlE